MKTCLTESTKISRRSFLQALGALTLSGSLAACGGTGKAKSDRLAAGSLAYTPDEVVTVEFSDGGITVSPENAAGLAVEETALSVSGAGVYALSGRCADGSVKVEAQTEGVVLLLDGLTLTGADTAPIVCGESTGVTIAVVDGTENTLTDSEANDPDNAADNEKAEKAVVKCKDGSQVILCGGGRFPSYTPTKYSLFPSILPTAIFPAVSGAMVLIQFLTCSNDKITVPPPPQTSA